MFDIRNTNYVWASLLTETLKRLGLKTVIISPGSRSTPLAVAFCRDNQLEKISVLDERSASFFALGIAKKSSLPTALVCTSGTAGANFYPAAIEARESRVPLLILTADRPPELRDCHSGQTINQVKLYGNYPNWQAELAIPSLELEMLTYLRQTVIQAWERALFPTPGVVHLNIPFRDPLAPITDPQYETKKEPLLEEDFFAFIDKKQTAKQRQISSKLLPLEDWYRCQKGLIIAGIAQPKFVPEYVAAIAHLSQTLGWPVLAEGLSPVRNYAHLNPSLISTYDLILCNEKLAQKLAPKMVIQVGEFPTSKHLRSWLKAANPQRWIIDPSDHNLDPLHGKTIHLRTAVETLVQPTTIASVSSEYLQLWYNAESQVRKTVDRTLAEMETLFEGKAAWLLSQTLPPKTPVFIANSMPVRDAELFWKANSLEIQPFFNRGANGIDGTLSTALGMAHRNQPSVLLTGDLALLHDVNGFLLKKNLVGHLTILLINNRGGGIFEMLPISQLDPPFEEFFAAPQDIDFAQLCATHKVLYESIDSWEQLAQRLNPLPAKGMRVLELRTDRKADAKWRQENLSKLATDSSPG